MIKTVIIQLQHLKRKTPPLLPHATGPPSVHLLMPRTRIHSLRRQVDQLKARLALKDEHRAGRDGVGFADATKAALDDTTEGGPDKGGGRSNGGNQVGGGYLGQDRPLLAARHGDSAVEHGWAFAAAGNSQRGDGHGAGDEADADADATPSERSSGGFAGTTTVEGACKEVGGVSRYHASPLPNDSLSTTLHCGTGVVEAHGESDESPEGRKSHDVGEDFERFKNEKGTYINSRLQDAKAAVKGGRSLANDLAGRVNKAKSRIDSARAQLQQQQEQGMEEEQRVGSEREGEEDEGAEEANVRRVLLAQLKRRKREYRRLFTLLAEAKADLRDLQHSKQQVLTKGR